VYVPTFVVWGIVGDADNEVLRAHLHLNGIDCLLCEFEPEHVKDDALPGLPMVYAHDMFLGEIDEFLSIPVATLKRIDAYAQSQPH
jgi:hypothetical protein